MLRWLSGTSKSIFVDIAVIFILQLFKEKLASFFFFLLWILDSGTIKVLKIS